MEAQGIIKVSPLLRTCVSTFQCANHPSPSWGLLFLFLESYYFLLSSLCTMNIPNKKSDAMKRVSPVTAKTLKTKRCLRSWFALLCEWWLQKRWKKVHAQYRKKMKMIPFTKERQTYCVIFFVLMVIGAIKLLVRSRRLVLFKNRVAQILVHNQWSKYTIGDQEKQHIFYCEMTIGSDLVLLHNNIRANICKSLQGDTV